ncbi:hypothetical protein Taro_055980 [Colocasia esculenta]|uniref:Uncharacterized protein n=1 Tax=Colocasia esculenta TaxID=4460 RepID=A0A843XV54_COLES|nr:hypothetical protein [Colocasia esculenta]
MASAFVTCGLALILISHMYFFCVMPIGSPAPDRAEGAFHRAEETEIYAFTIYLFFVVGLVLVLCVGLAPVDVVGRGRVDAREEVEGAIVDGQIPSNAT